MTDLVRQAMRIKSRPTHRRGGARRGGDRPVPAFNTGHEGGCATIHANSAHDVMTRLEALATRRLPAEAVQAMAAIDAVVHVHRVEGRRQVQEIVSWPPQRSGLSMMVREVVPR